MQSTTMTEQQQAIREAATELLATLDATIPTSTAHYAVEDARRALAKLARVAGTVHTYDQRRE